MIKTNYHTHTTFCDGKNSVEEMAKAAIARGFDILGFSSHSMCTFSTEWHLPVRSHSEYAAEVRRVQHVFADKISIQLGFESDYLYALNTPQKSRYAAFKPDYLIGAVHYVMNENGAFAVDESADSLQQNIQRVFGGNVREVVHQYFENEREMLKKGDFDIIAHADLIRKYNARLHLFDERSTEYRAELKSLADCIARAGVIAEVNTGGIARGCTSEPYPSQELLSLLFERGVPVTINSDAHRCEHLDFWFDEAMSYIKKAGYKTIAYLESSEIKFQKIN